MKIICSYNNCTGCALCAANCPKSCISMNPIDNLGHLFPVVNQETCIDCGLCQKSCPSLNPLERTEPMECFAAWSKDDVDYKTSTSGAAASVFSSYIVCNGGVVYGCAVLPGLDVKHIRVDNANDLKKLKGSKYVQSSIEECLPLLKKDVKQKLPVLFIGTPCQVAAVKKLFDSQPDNLYLIDIICHGTPSLDFLKDHVKKKAPDALYDKVVFRNGNRICLEILSENQDVYYTDLTNKRFEDLYLNSFFDGFSYRDSCYNCQYANPKRVGDVTIGDFWGLGKVVPADEIPDHKNGCSVLLPCSEKGKVLIEKVSSQFNIFERSVEEAVKGNHQLQHPYYLDWRRKIYRCVVRLLNVHIYHLCVFDKFLKYKLRKALKK